MSEFTEQFIKIEIQKSDKEKTAVLEFTNALKYAIENEVNYTALREKIYLEQKHLLYTIDEILEKQGILWGVHTVIKTLHNNDLIKRNFKKEHKHGST